jgi:hypothetical protein
LRTVSQFRGSSKIKINISDSHSQLDAQMRLLFRDYRFSPCNAKLY